MAVRNVREGAFEPCALVHEGTDAFSVVLVKGAAGSQRVRSHFEGLALAKAVNEARLHASTNLSSVSHQEPLPRVGPASEPEVQIAPAMQREPAVEEERCTVAVQPILPAGNNVRMPEAGEPVLCLTKKWLERILSGAKTLELRGQPTRHKFIWLAERNVIAGSARVCRIEALNDKQFVKLWKFHGVDGDKAPYKKTYGLWLTDVVALRKPRQFMKLRGAIGWSRVRFSGASVQASIQKQKQPQCQQDAVDMGCAGVCSTVPHNGEPQSVATTSLTRIEEHCLVPEKNGGHACCSSSVFI